MKTNYSNLLKNRSLYRIGAIITMTALMALNVLTTQSIYAQGVSTLLVQFESREYVPVCDSVGCVSVDQSFNDMIQNLQMLSCELAFPEIEKFSQASNYDLDFIYQIEFNISEQAAIDSLILMSGIVRHVERIEEAELTYTPNDYHLLDADLGPNWQLDMIQAKDAWDISGDVAGEIVIGIVEPGSAVSLTHPDLSANVLSATGPQGGWHATAVAACASATTDNNYGISAIGFNAAIRGYQGWGINHWLEAVSDGCHIINCSYRTCSFNQWEANTIEMIADMGVVMVASAANGPGQVSCSPNGMGYAYPASYDCVISVSSVSEQNTFYFTQGDFHHTANDKVDVCAPGYQVLTIHGGSFVRYNGTSFSSPITAGLVALIKKVNPCLGVKEVKDILQATADPIDDAGDWPGVLGAGRINAYQAVLMAQSYGNHDPIVASTVWDSEMYVSDELVIESGATLTITDKVRFGPNAKVIVEQNAELIIDGGHLTNSSGCGTDFWQGIELWGTTSATQLKVSGYRAQGYLQIKNGGIIENAIIGVTNYKPGDDASVGGVIDARDGEFNNNQIAVDFDKYQNIQPGSGNPLPNLSKFKGTKFIINDDYVGDFETEGPEAQVKLYGVDGVSFTACEFINTSTVSESEQRSKGIYSEDAHYRVLPACASVQSVGTPCPAADVIPTVFDGFYRGIDASKVTDGFPILVSGAEFKNNMIGVELVNLDFSEIIKSKFEIGGHPHETWTSGAYRNHLGIYSKGTRCFAIEENEFIKDPNALWDERNGVLVYQSEANSNNVYLNHFKELENAGIGYQVNRNLSGFIGLQFNCNDMTENFHDFVVSRDTEEEDTEESGIRTYQGSFSPMISAGNSFSVPNGDSNEYTHWDINSESGYFYYHSAVDAPDEEEVTPNKLYPYLADISHACASNYSSSGGHKPAIGKGGVIQEYNQKRSDYYNLLYTYKQIIDDGNTDGTIDEVIATWPEDAWDLYDMLMARSPNNSEEVLITAADREIMPHAMLLEVLLANPDALRNGRVINHVENNLNNPMPSYMIDILHAASDQTTLRTTMESTLANHHSEMTRNYNFIIQFYTTDTINGVHNDSLLYYLGQMDSPTGKYNLAGRLMSIGENTLALNMIDSIPVNYRLTTSQNNEWKAMQALFSLLDDADRNNRSIARLDSTELMQLETIAMDPDGGIGALRARKALCFFYQNCISGPALPKNMSAGHKKPLPPLDELLSKLDKVTAFPNPAKDYLTFSYSFFREQAPNRQLRVFNQNGALIQTFDLGKAQEGQQLWDTRKTTPGIYIYDVYEGERKVHAGKIVIQ